MKLLSLILLLHVTRVKLYAITYQRQLTGNRNGWWVPSYWWRRQHQPGHHPERFPMVVTPYVITVTEQRGSIPPVTSSTERPNTKVPSKTTPTESSLATATPTVLSTNDHEETATVGIVTSTDDSSLRTANVSIGSTTTSIDIQRNLTGSFTNQTDILLKCGKLRPKALRDACARVAKNPILDGVEGVRGYVGDEELNVRSFITARGLIVRQPLGRQIFCDGPDTCPNLDINNLPTQSNLRSTSPWVICQEYDPNRFPQWLNTAQCLCDGCIDLRTGSENGGSVVSQPLTVDVTVIRKNAIGKKFSECNTRICREEVQSIAIGCHCALASLRISSRTP